MKIAVIGPIPPFRGGIAHSNQWLCENLALNNEVIAVSFKRLFPSMLYPGKSQKEPAVIKSKNNFRKEFLIDSINPFNWLNVVAFLKKSKPDVLIFQWWHPFFAPAFIFLASLAKKFFKPKTIAVIHCVLPHEGSFIDKTFTKAFFSKIDRFIILSASQEKELKDIMPKSEIIHIVIPSFEAVAKNKDLSVEEAKKMLGIKGNMLLFFGFVRRYKGLNFLLEAMPEVLKQYNVTLVIAGEFWDDKESYISKIKALGIEKNIVLRSDYIPLDETAKYFKAADAIVLPYTSSTHSGIIEMAYTYNTPIITTSVGGHSEFIEDKVSGLLVEPANPKALAEAIVFFYKNNLGKQFKEQMKLREKMFEWSNEKEKTLLS